MQDDTTASRPDLVVVVSYAVTFFCQRVHLFKMMTSVLNARYSTSPQALALRRIFLRTVGQAPSTLNIDSGKVCSIF